MEEAIKFLEFWKNFWVDFTLTLGTEVSIILDTDEEGGECHG